MTRRAFASLGFIALTVFAHASIAAAQRPQRDDGSFATRLMAGGVVVLSERHLYTDDAHPAGSTDDFVTYHSWYFKRGRSTGQPYAGIGMRF